MALLIKNLYDIRDKIDRRSPILKVFFDAKYNEIIEYMKKYPDKNVFEQLNQLILHIYQNIWKPRTANKFDFNIFGPSHKWLGLHNNWKNSISTTHIKTFKPVLLKYPISF